MLILYVFDAMRRIETARGDATEPMPGRDLKQLILAEAAIEDRDAHGLPRLRG